MAGSTMENALEKIADMTPAFAIDESTVIGPLKTQVDHINRRREGGGRR